MSINGKRQVIIISLPGIVQESIRAMLEAIPGVEVVGLAGGGLTALALVQDKRPDVVIIDGNLSEDEVLAFLKDVREVDTNVRRVVLTHTTRQQRRILSGSADVILSRWGPAEEFINAVLGSD